MVGRRTIRIAFVRILIAPSMALQRLTTSEPEASMLEVAIVSLKRVLVAEQAWPRAEVERAGIVAVDEAGRHAADSGAACRARNSRGLNPHGCRQA